jgi:hypothetical protein
MKPKSFSVRLLALVLLASLVMAACQPTVPNTGPTAAPIA